MGKSSKIIFVTGTDTGVGKTVFTALLLQHLRAAGCHALAMKPFCSGTRGDVKLLQSLQKGELPEAEMNPFYFPEPVAPLLSRKAPRQGIKLAHVLARIRSVCEQCEVLLVEGSGGLLVPLGKGFSVSSLIEQLDCQPIAVARNRLGTINHTLLTVGALQAVGKPPLAVVLMDQARGDHSSRTNCKALKSLLRPVHVLEFPFLGARMTQIAEIQKAANMLRESLARLTKLAGVN